MNEKALRTLEYNKIIKMLSELAGSSRGKELCEGLLPSSDLSEITRCQKETTDALSRLLRRGTLSFSGIHDIRSSLLRLKVGSALGIVELLHISSILDATARVKAYGRCTNKDDTEYTEDSLTGYFAGLEP